MHCSHVYSSITISVYTQDETDHLRGTSVVFFQAKIEPCAQNISSMYWRLPMTEAAVNEIKEDWEARQCPALYEMCQDI